MAFSLQGQELRLTTGGTHGGHHRARGGVGDDIIQCAMRCPDCDRDQVGSLLSVTPSRNRHDGGNSFWGLGRQIPERRTLPCYSQTLRFDRD